MKVRADWPNLPGADKWLGIHPTYPRFKRWTVLMRHASGRLETRGQRSFWTRAGADRYVKRCQYNEMWTDERNLMRGLPLAPGVRFEVFDMHKHPGRLMD